MKKLLLAILLIVSFSGKSQISIINLPDYFSSIYELEKARNYKSIDKKTAFDAINKSIKLAQRNNFSKNLANSYYIKSKIFDFYAQYDSSFIYYQLAEPIFEILKDSVNAAKCLINIGVTHYYYNNTDSALFYYQKAKIFLQNSNEYTLLAKTLNNIALINKKLGYYNEAITYLQKTIDIYEKIDNTEGIATAYQNIGIIYWEQKNYNLALETFEIAKNIYENNNNFDDLAAVLTNIGLIYSDLNDTTNALVFYDKAINLYRQTNNKQGIATVLHNKGSMLNETKFYDEAELLIEQALAIFSEIKYKPGIFLCKASLSSIYTAKKEHIKAIKTSLEVIQLSDNQQIAHLKDAYWILAQNYQSISNYKDAFFYLNKYVAINDSIFSLEKNKQLNEIRTKYETEKKETEIAILNKNAKIAKLEMERKKRKMKIISISLIIILIFFIASIILYFQKQKSYQALVEQNIKLAQFDIEKEKQNIKDEDKTKKVLVLDNEQKQQLSEDIIEQMEKNKVFLNPQLTINTFAKTLNSNRNYISQIINDVFQTNFNNFVNEYRIKEARKLLLNPDYQHFTIEGIAHEVGFHSKATFNNAFKKFTGVTPSFFKKNSQKK